MKLALLLLAAYAATFADTIVVPVPQATASGDASTGFGHHGEHYQEIIGSGQFGAIDILPIQIVALRLRSWPGGGAVNFTFPSLQLTLSTTQAFPNTNGGHKLPSTTFANNLGPDATVVYNSAFSASSPGCQAPGPCPLDMVITFATPFNYDPTQGRLLVDFVGAPSSQKPIGGLDLMGYGDSTKSFVVSVSGDLNAATGSLFLGGLVLGLDYNAPSVYYFPQLAFGGGWQTTLTYVGLSLESTNCATRFYADSGEPLPVPFEGAPASGRSDILAPGATLHQQTTSSASDPVTSGWATALCNSSIKASILYRYYKQGVAQGEAGVNAATLPGTEFVTFAEPNTGVACANVSGTTATVTITAVSATGVSLGSKAIELAPNAHSAANIGSLLGLAAGSFTGSVQITSNTPIVSLSLNAEAFPVFSALPPGDVQPGTPLPPE